MPYGDLWEWNGSSWAHAYPPPTEGASLACDTARMRIVQFGGSRAWRETFEWNGETWVRASVSGPSARQFAAMTYDSSRQKTVLFGGENYVNGTIFGDTWEWDSAAWTQRATSGPSPRTGAAFVFDSAREVTVLFGGGGGVALGDTWEWNGTAWNQRLVSGPPARGGAAAAYDSIRHRVVLFGGGGASVFSDTWEWDGQAWVQVATSGPGPRSAAQMVFVPALAKCVLVGGVLSGVGTFNDAWAWDGVAWSALSPAGSLPPIYNMGMAALPTGDGLILYGGQTTSGYFVGSTWELGFGPARILSQPRPRDVTAGSTVQFEVQAAGGGPISFQWERGGVPLQDGGRISGTVTSRLTIAAATEQDSDQYTCSVSNPCGATMSDPAILTVRPNCYPNCDGSTVLPRLNFADFSCFLQRFASGDPYANCDSSSQPPVLNVLDFSCFLQRFAAGCP